MTVSELIQALQRFDPIKEVMICNTVPEHDGALSAYDVESIDPFEDNEGGAVLLMADLSEDPVFWLN
jgi:hypothetical protein